MKIGVFGHGRCQITESLGKINLVHQVISRRHTAVGQLADFQGANDEHI